MQASCLSAGGLHRVGPLERKTRRGARDAFGRFTPLYWQASRGRDMLKRPNRGPAAKRRSPDDYVFRLPT